MTISEYNLENCKDSRVLVVDDDPDILVVVKMLFSELGFESIVCTEDPVIAQRKLAASKFDLVLCDWHMPHLKGIDILREVRQTEPDLPFIMLTTEQNQENVVAAIEAGVNEYLLKPVRVGRLAQVIKRVLDKSDH